MDVWEVVEREHTEHLQLSIFVCEITASIDNETVSEFATVSSKPTGKLPWPLISEISVSMNRITCHWLYQNSANLFTANYSNQSTVSSHLSIDLSQYHRIVVVDAQRDSEKQRILAWLFLSFTILSFTSHLDYYIMLLRQPADGSLPTTS